MKLLVRMSIDIRTSNFNFVLIVYREDSWIQKTESMILESNQKRLYTLQKVLNPWEFTVDLLKGNNLTSWLKKVRNIIIIHKR